MNKTDNPQGFVLDMYKQANLPLVQERLFGELSGRDVIMYNRVWTYLEGSMTFAATALQAIAFFVKDVALTVLALIPAIISSDARRFVEVHVAHMLQDLVAIPVGIIGFVSPHAGTFLAKAAINLFISLFQDSEAKEKLHDLNGEFVEATALGVHLMAQLNAFAERGAVLEKEQAALLEGEFDREADDAINQKLTDLDAEQQAWIQDHADQIRQASKGLFDDQMPYVRDASGNGDDGFIGKPIPTFKQEHEEISGIVWRVVYGGQSLDDLMNALEEHCDDYGAVYDALEAVVTLEGDFRTKGRALIREIKDYLPHLFEDEIDDLFDAAPRPLPRLPVFAPDHQAICDTVWKVANKEQTLEDLMGMLAGHCEGNTDAVRAALHMIVERQASVPHMGQALTLAIHEFMPHLFVSTFSDDDEEFFGRQDAVPAFMRPSTAHAVAERPLYADNLNDLIDGLVRLMNAGDGRGQSGITNFLGQLGHLAGDHSEIKVDPTYRANLEAALKEKLTTMYADPDVQPELTANEVRDILRAQSIPGLVVAYPVVNFVDEW